jgi:hypothetical protein
MSMKRTHSLMGFIEQILDRPVCMVRIVRRTVGCGHAILTGQF